MSWHTDNDEMPYCQQYVSYDNQHSSPNLSSVELAKKYYLHRPTVAKWRSREEMTDQSHYPK